MFTRRPAVRRRSPRRCSCIAWCCEGARRRFAGYETDRARSTAAAATLRAPAALAAEGPLRGHGRRGARSDHEPDGPGRARGQGHGDARLRDHGRALARRGARAGAQATARCTRCAGRSATPSSRARAWLARTSVEPALVPSIQRLCAPALLFADPALRATPRRPAADAPCQRRLWGRGISGDDPIVLVRVHDAGAPLLGEVSGRAALSCAGAACASIWCWSTTRPRATPARARARCGACSAQHDDGLARPARRHPRARRRPGLRGRAPPPRGVRARVVLDTRDGSLARAPEPRWSSHRRSCRGSSRRSAPTPARRARGRGHWPSTTARAASPKTVASTSSRSKPGSRRRRRGATCSPTRSSAAWSASRRWARPGRSTAARTSLTPWRNDPVFDTRPPRSLYLRDEETAAGLVADAAARGARRAPRWSATAPATRRYERDEPRPRAGDDRVRAARRAAQDRAPAADEPARAPPPPDRDLLRRVGARRPPRRPDLTHHLGARSQQRGPARDLQLERRSSPSRSRSSPSEDKVHGFTTDRAEFLGRRGDYARPEALERWGSVGRRSRPAAPIPCAALQVHLELAPGETLETHFVLGQAANRDEALALVARFRDARRGRVAAWQERSARSGTSCSATSASKTPEPAMDLMLNRWLLYQNVSSRLFGRMGFYQASGAFGFRDQLQDVLALVHARAGAHARAHARRRAHQFEEGDVLHWWHPPAGRGVRTRCSDDLLWLPFVTAEYVAATGDVAILDEPVPFLTGAPLGARTSTIATREYERAPTAASLLEHCRRALERGATEGAHGLPLMGDGDWNDGMNRVGIEGRGESVWLGWFLCATMDRFRHAVRAHGDATPRPRRGAPAPRRCARRSSAAPGTAPGTCARSTTTARWSARPRAASAASTRSRSRGRCCRAACPTPRGAPTPTRARGAVRAADDQLVREAERLVLLFWPPFRHHAARSPATCAPIPPGIRENGGQYTHAATRGSAGPTPRSATASARAHLPPCSTRSSHARRPPPARRATASSPTCSPPTSTALAPGSASRRAMGRAARRLDAGVSPR